MAQKTYTVGGKTYTKAQLIASLQKQQAAIRAEKTEPAVKPPAPAKTNVFNQPAYGGATKKTTPTPTASQPTGLSQAWIDKNINPATGKSYAEEARAVQVAGATTTDKTYAEGVREGLQRTHTWNSASGTWKPKDVAPVIDTYASIRKSIESELGRKVTAQEERLIQEGSGEDMLSEIKSPTSKEGRELYGEGTQPISAETPFAWSKITNVSQLPATAQKDMETVVWGTGGFGDYEGASLHKFTGSKWVKIGDYVNGKLQRVGDASVKVDDKTAPVDISKYSAEWQAEIAKGLDPNWVQQNVNPATGKTYAEEARAKQVAEQPLTPIQDEVLGDSDPVAVSSDSARLDVIKEEADKQIEIEKETEGTQAEITQLTQKQQLQNLRTELGLDPESGEKLERPGVPTYETSYEAFRSEEGIPALESRINTLDEQIRDTGASLREGLYDQEGRLAPMELLGTRQRELARQGQEAIDTLNREKQTLVDELTTKTTLVSNLMNFKKMDYETASADYTSRFNEKISLMNMIEGRETAEQNEQNRLRDDSRANLSVMTDMMSDQGIIWDELGPNLQTQMANLEIKAGLPSGITQAFINEKPDAKVMAQTISYDENGNQIVSFIYEGADGKPGVVESVQTGGKRETTEAGGGDGGGTIFTGVDDEQMDFSTPEGLARALELGYTYEDVYNALDQSTKWSAGVISDKLKRAGFQTVEEETKATERSLDDSGIIDAIKTNFDNGLSKSESKADIGNAKNMTEADRKRALELLEEKWQALEDLKKGKKEREDTGIMKYLPGYLKEKLGVKEAEAAELEEPIGQTTKQKGILYEIISGDTLSEIASKHGTTVKKLQEINNIVDINKIQAGATIKIPVPGGPIDI